MSAELESFIISLLRNIKGREEYALIEEKVCIGIREDTSLIEWQRRDASDSRFFNAGKSEVLQELRDLIVRFLESGVMPEEYSKHPKENEHGAG
jgi:hypothetical protein